MRKNAKEDRQASETNRRTETAHSETRKFIKIVGISRRGPETN